MGGILPDSARVTAMSRLRKAAEAALANPDERRRWDWPTNREKLRREWNVFPECYGEPCPEPAEVLRMLDESDRQREQGFVKGKVTK